MYMRKKDPLAELAAAIEAAKAKDKTPEKAERTGYRHADPVGTILETDNGPMLRLDLPLTVDPNVRTGSSKGLQLQRATRHRLTDASGRPVEVLGQQVYVAFLVDVTLPRALWDPQAVADAAAKRKVQ